MPMTVEELRERKKNAWEEFKKVRSYQRPIYFDERNRLIGDGSPKLLNRRGFQLLYQFREIDKDLQKALWEKEKENE